MKKKVISIIAIVLMAFIVIVINKIFFNNNHKNNTPKYRLETDMQLKTLQNDGGSHTNQYYLIDFQNSHVTKYEDSYEGFNGYVYKDKQIYDKKLNQKDNKKLLELINKIIEAKDDKIDYSKLNYMYYLLITPDNVEIEYNNYEIIEQIENILKQ